MRRHLLLTAAIVLTATIGLLAQGVTTATLKGTIKDSKGEVPGANIVAVHVPTGTSYGTVSAADGTFVISNMRVGGPYKVTVSFVGYVTQSYDDINLELASPYVLNHVMKEEGTQLEEVVVIGENDRAANNERAGAITNISTRQLLVMPSITRSLNDMLRMTPQGTSTATGAIGGGNYRQNNFTVDGADFNNTFGIGTNLPAGGNPISLDALETVSISLTPFDVRQANFIGSSINAVTRSGTNNFQGSAYTYFRTQNQQGSQVASETPITVQRLDVKTYGFRLGGPILKNKLFFFVNYEQTNEIRPGQTNIPSDANNVYGGGNPQVTRPDVTTMNTYGDFLRTNYKYEPGPYAGYDFKSNNNRMTARFDWNINTNHRFSVRYSQVESKSPSFMSSSRAPFSLSYAGTAGRTTTNALPFGNAAYYYQEANLYSWAMELNSTFGGKFSNILRATITHQNDPRGSDSAVFPFVDILDGSQPATSTTNLSVPYTSFGYEPFTYGNLRDVKTTSIVDNLSWTSGKHSLTAGVQVDFSSTRNGFQRFATSYYTFNSWNDFSTGQKPRDFGLTYSLLPGFEQAFPTIKTAQYSLYGQDEFSFSNKLRFTFGLRIDRPGYLATQEIQTHPLVAALTFYDGRKVDTGALPDPAFLFSPRVGFNYDVKGDRSMIIRGGTGVFSGKVPTVWLVAQSGDAGMIQFTQLYTGQAATPGPFNPDPNYYRPGSPGNPGPLPPAGATIPSAGISELNQNFKFPQTWKTSLALDMKLPWGMVGTLEGIFNKDLIIAKGINVNLVDPAPLNSTNGVGGALYPDNRPIYPNPITNRFINPLTTAGLAVPNGNAAGTVAFNTTVLSNAGQGYYGSLTLRLDKQFSKGFFASVAYTKTEAKVLFDGIGDQLFNTWSLNQISNNANFPNVANAGYVVPDRVIASVSYRKEYLKHLATTVSLFYEGSITGRFSYTYSADINRDGQTNDLIYIPKDPSEITFVANTTVVNGVTTVYSPQQQSDMFFQYIAQDKYLSKHMGEYAERNGGEFPWRSQVDLKLIQDIFTNIGGRNNSLQLTVDIFNFGNFINKDWGIYKQLNQTAILVPQNTAALVPNGTVTPTFRLGINSATGQPVTETFRNNNSITSTYYMQFGLRYNFN